MPNAKERRYRIRGGHVQETVTCTVPIVVAQTEPEEKPNFFQARLVYGGMSRESADKLTEIVDAYRGEIAKALGLDEIPEEIDIEGNYDKLMVVQQMTARLVESLAAMGFAFAKEKGIEIPMATKLLEEGRR